MTAAQEPVPHSRGAVGWGILATGGIARLFARDLVLNGHRIAAVGSRSLSNAQRFADDFDIPTAYGSYLELVADPQVDVVYVATPHTFHANDAMSALDHDKHVLVEKSFTINAPQARAVVDRGRDRQRLVMEAMWTRFLPHMGFVRDTITSGRIGTIRSVHADHTQQLPSDPTHRLNDLRLGGGALLDLGVYPLSFAHDLLGAPTEITARGVLSSTGADTSVATILRHAGDTVSTSYSSMDTLGSNTATVLGTDGRLEIASIWYGPAAVTLHDARGDLVERFDQPVRGRGMQYQATEVERLIESGETASPLMTPEGSVEVMATMDQIRVAIGVRYPDE